MDREIKFRIWYPRNKKFGYFSLLGTYVVFHQNNIPASDKEATIQQFTGLKDNNGQGIYEGDILQLFPSSKDLSENTSSEGIFEVKWIKPSFRGYSKSNKIVTYIDLDMYDSAIGCSSRFYCKVIGNIFENPELLKENS